MKTNKVIRLSEGQLRVIIENVANEVYSSEHNNYEQYVDWVEEITTEGTVSSNYSSIEQFIGRYFDNYGYYEIGYNYKFYHGYVREEFDNEEYDNVIESLKEQYGDKIYGESRAMNGGFGTELSEYGQKILYDYLLNEGKEALIYYFNNCRKKGIITDDCMVQVERTIDVPEKTGKYLTRYNVDLYNVLKNTYTNLGEYWAIGWGNSGSYRDSYFDEAHSLSELKIRGLVPIEHIDWANTIGVSFAGEDETYFDQCEAMFVSLVVDDDEIPFETPRVLSSRGKLRRFINESISDLLLCESVNDADSEQMLVDLYNYLSQEPTDDIYDGGTHGKHYINTSYKAYNYFEPRGIVHNVWGVHYTNLEGFEGIQSSGFRIGVSDNDALAYSQGYHNYEAPRKSGWNFALPIDSEYLGEDLGYGDCGFVILTDGVRAYHKGDGDDEIIFKDCMVKKKYPFVYDEDYDCWILSGFDCQDGELPNGAYYEEELGQVVFEDVYSLVKYVVSR